MHTDHGRDVHAVKVSNAAPPETPGTRTVTPSSDRAAGGNREPRVLVVDDEALICDVVAAFLRRLGCMPTSATTCAEAVEIFRREHTRIDLVLVDMHMPDDSGLGFFADLKAIDPDVKALLTTGYDLEAYARQAHEAGMDGLLRKPYSMEALAERVEASLSA
jgi:CheY-like chemotaxis protein